MATWIKFNLVGVTGFVLQTAALFLLTRGMPRLSYLIATALAVELAVLNNFVWHHHWTWRDRPTSTGAEIWRRLGRFNLTTGLVSIGGNLLLMSVFVGRFRLPIILANLVTVIICSVMSFILADRFAFTLPAEAQSYGSP